jgi:DNA invertase Pin-like site-specific DNA recombinase
MKKINASDLINLDDKFMLEVAEKLEKLKSESNSDKALLKTTEVADLLKVSRHTVVRYIKNYFEPEAFRNTP